jgi:hypothetical protein
MELPLIGGDVISWGTRQTAYVIGFALGVTAIWDAAHSDWPRLIMSLGGISFVFYYLFPRRRGLFMVSGVLLWVGACIAGFFMNTA